MTHEGKARCPSHSQDRWHTCAGGRLGSCSLADAPVEGSWWRTVSTTHRTEQPNEPSCLSSLPVLRLLSKQQQIAEIENLLKRSIRSQSHKYCTFYVTCANGFVTDLQFHLWDSICCSVMTKITFYTFASFAWVFLSAFGSRFSITWEVFALIPSLNPSRTQPGSYLIPETFHDFKVLWPLKHFAFFVWITSGHFQPHFLS